jgi:hypothetical protein
MIRWRKRHVLAGGCVFENRTKSERPECVSFCASNSSYPVQKKFHSFNTQNYPMNWDTLMWHFRIRSLNHFWFNLCAGSPGITIECSGQYQ